MLSGSLRFVKKDSPTDIKVRAQKLGFYPKKDFTRFLGELFETAANNNLAVKNVTYKPDLIKEEGLIAYSIGFNVSGNYAAIKSFISDIARSRQIITIDTISLSNGNPTQESLDLKLQITTYLRIEEGA